MKQKPECEILRSGIKEWRLKGKLHREDGPAVEYPDGTKQSYLNGSLHRLGGPAVEYSSGTKEWWVNGKPHREDGPAIEHFDGTKTWFLNGEKIHPETLADLWLEREVFCWYDEANETLNFAEINEQA